MKNEIKTQKADINVSNILKTVHEAVVSCYGVVGLADKVSVSHNETNSKKGKKEEAIFVKKSNKTFDVDIYLVLSNSVKITETLVSAQDTITYSLKKEFGKALGKVNIFAQSVSSK